ISERRWADLDARAYRPRAESVHTLDRHDLTPGLDRMRERTVFVVVGQFVVARSNIEEIKSPLLVADRDQLADERRSRQHHRRTRCRLLVRIGELAMHRSEIRARPVEKLIRDARLLPLLLLLARPHRRQ